MKPLLSSEELWQKINQLKATGKIDLSVEEDLSIAVMNLISLEEHLFFTAEKTNKDEYLVLLERVRAMRKDLLAEMMPQNEGETWCISKHLLAATMRLIEVANKRQVTDSKEAAEMFAKAYELYQMFWELRLGLLGDISLSAENTQISPKKDLDKQRSWTKEDILGKLIDCCKE